MGKVRLGYSHLGIGSAAICGCHSIRTGQAYFDEIMANSPVGYWRLGETSGTQATDESATPHHGTYSGGVTLGVPGLFGSANMAAQFNGSTGYVVTPSFAITSAPSTLTIEAIVKCSSHPNNQSILSDAAQAAAAGFLWLYRPSNSNNLTFQYATGVAIGTFTAADYFLGLDNTDLHIAVVVDYAKKAIDFYRNGALFSNQTTGSTMLYPSANRIKYIGGYDLDNTTDFFSGVIDEVAIFNRSFGIDQISSLYKSLSQGGKLRAYNEPPAVVGDTRVGGSSSLFYPTGQGVWRLDLGAIPQVTRGYVRISQGVPAGTSLTHTLKASNTGAFAGEEVNLGAVIDSTQINAAYRHFKLTSAFASNTQRDQSPLIDYFDVIYQRGYPSQGSCDLLLDVGFTPEYDGTWEIDSIVPAGTTLTLTAQASNRELFDTEVEEIGAIANGSISKRKRFYKVHLVFTTDGTATQTPRLTRIKANFPNG